MLIFLELSRTYFGLGNAHSYKTDGSCPPKLKIIKSLNLCIIMKYQKLAQPYLMCLYCRSFVKACKVVSKG